MEIIAANAQVLLSFIGHACNNADSRQTGIKPFDFVKIQSVNGVLSITGSNGNQTFIRECDSAEVQAKSDGCLCVDSEKLFQVAKNLPKDLPVKLKKVNGKDRAALSAGRSRLQLKTIESTEYPTLEVLKDSAKQVTVKAVDLLSLIDGVIFAAAKNDIRHYLNCINLKINNGHLYATASDGHRLTSSKIKVDENIEPMEMLLPINSMQVLSRLNELPEDITLSFCDSRAEFNWGGLIYRTGLVEARFPDVSRLIPTKFDSSLTINRLDIIETLKRLLVMVSSEAFPKLKLSTHNNQVKFDTIIANEDDGMGEDYIAAQCDGNQLDYEYILNPKYLLDALSHIYTDDISVGFRGANEACCISPVNDHNTKSIIMPVRV